MRGKVLFFLLNDFFECPAMVRMFQWEMVTNGPYIDDVSLRHLREKVRKDLNIPRRATWFAIREILQDHPMGEWKPIYYKKRVWPLCQFQYKLNVVPGTGEWLCTVRGPTEVNGVAV